MIFLPDFLTQTKSSCDIVELTNEPHPLACFRQVLFLRAGLFAKPKHMKEHFIIIFFGGGPVFGAVAVVTTLILGFHLGYHCLTKLPI